VSKTLVGSRSSYQKKYVDEATREYILQFMIDCHKLGLGNRTGYDKLVVVLQLRRLENLWQTLPYSY
jgi:hypothetical protein